jgi:hypothetical protein
VSEQPGETASDEDVIVHSDPVGAANLMKEIVSEGCHDAALEEEGGHWHVVVRASGGGQTMLAEVIDLVAHCVDTGRMSFATLVVGKRNYTIAPLGLRAAHTTFPSPPPVPVAAA